MPPKKKVEADTEAAANNEAGETKFAWTTENDRALLILCFGRNPTTEDYAKFVDALPAGASYNGVKIRCSKMRMEMKKRYEELGWEVPETTTAKSKTATKEQTEPKAKAKAEPKAKALTESKTSKKRKGSAEAEESGEGAEGKDSEEGVKAKKPRAKKGEGKKKGVKEELKGGEDGGEGDEAAAKEEDE